MQQPGQALTSDLSAQASPSDPDNFPFVVLGNKVDMDEGRSRVVRTNPPNAFSICQDVIWTVVHVSAIACVSAILWQCR